MSKKMRPKKMFNFHIDSSFLRKIVPLFLLLSACQNIQPVTPSSVYPTALSTETNPLPTATEVSSVATDNQLGPSVTPLPQFDDYIIYSKFETRTDYKIWAINPKDPIPRLLSTNVKPWNWSPSNKLWLFVGNQSIYVANVDGSDAHAVYTNEEYQAIEPFWLTDEIVLLNAYKDVISLPPEIYSLTITTGAIARLFPGESKFIQATFPSEERFLLADWPVGPLSVVDQDNRSEIFFNDFSIPTNIFSPYPPIQRVNKLDSYLFKAKGPSEFDYKLWLASQQEDSQVFFDPGSDGIDQFMVSPDERYVALTFNALNGVYLYVFSLENFQLLHEWVYPYTLSTGYFAWSPDSQSVVLPYSEFDVGNSTEVHFGIQVMDVTTGETTIVLKEDVNEILHWHFIE
jgi:hypothetical protein